MFINSQLLNNNNQSQVREREIKKRFLFNLFQLLPYSINDPSRISSRPSGGFATPTAPHLSPTGDKTPLPSHRHSNGSAYFAGDEELSLQSPNDLDIPHNSSSSSSNAASPQQHSPVAVRTAPLYISVYTSSPPIPLVKGIVASSAPPTTDDGSFFTRRSPSPQPSSVLRKNEQLNSTTPPAAYKYQQYPSTQQQK
jgi:hypothetical protein